KMSPEQWQHCLTDAAAADENDSSGEFRLYQFRRRDAGHRTAPLSFCISTSLSVLVGGRFDRVERIVRRRAARRTGFDLALRLQPVFELVARPEIALGRQLVSSLGDLIVLFGGNPGTGGRDA